jgi:hypothetical protein
MSEHLKDTDVADALAGCELDVAARRHLEGCITCRREVAALGEAIGDRRREMQRGEPDWQAQRAAALGRLAAAPSRREHGTWWRPVLALAATVVIAFAIGLLSKPSENRPAGRELAVEEVLAETEALLDDDSIPGFEIIDPGLDALERSDDNGLS